MTSQPSGAASSSATWIPGRPRSRSPATWTGDLRRDGTVAVVRASPLDLGPGLDPVRVVLAGGAAAVAALLDRGRPVGDLREVGLVVGVERLAVLLVGGQGARLRSGR